MKRSANVRGGFTLVEVIVALGVLGIFLPVMLALLGRLARTGREAGDAGNATRMAAGVQDELERLQGVLGWEGLAAAMPPAGTAAPWQLVGTRDGLRVRRADGAAADAERPPDDATLPGIAPRDRFFLAEVTQSPDLPYVAGAGFLAVSVRITWPHRLPVGPASPDPGTEASEEVPRDRRRWMLVTMALRP